MRVGDHVTVGDGKLSFRIECIDLTSLQVYLGSLWKWLPMERLHLVEGGEAKVVTAR